MKRPKRNHVSRWATAAMVLAAALALGACAAGNILKFNEVDIGALMRSDAGKQKFNVIRFQTYGPVAEQSSQP